MQASSLADRYRIVHQQGLVPIFVPDRFDAVQLAEAAVAAGAHVVEITCRRPTASDDIRRVRAAFPELLILAGSVVDDGPMFQFLRRRLPGVPSITELGALGVDGFVSAMPLSLETVARLAETHLVIPGVETITEAVGAVEAGAHFAKFFNTVFLGEARRVALATSAPFHGLLPIFVTGGVTLEKIDGYIAAQTAVLGSGWDVILGDRYQALQDRPDPAELAAALRCFLAAVARARCCHQPTLGGFDTPSYLRSIPHYHPFARLGEA